MTQIRYPESAREADRLVHDAGQLERQGRLDLAAIILERAARLYRDAGHHGMARWTDEHVEHMATKTAAIAERRLGEMLTLPNGKDRRGRPNKNFHRGSILPDGVSHKDSHRWQRLHDETFLAPAAADDDPLGLDDLPPLPSIDDDIDLGELLGLDGDSDSGVDLGRTFTAGA
jgi:hypothetical protein